MTMLKTLPLVLVLLYGCTFAPGNLQSKYSSDLESRRIRRIAVLPPEAPAIAPTTPAAKTGLPSLSSADTPSQKDHSDILARQIYSAMASLPNWQIVADTEVQQVEQTSPSAVGAGRLKQLGELVFADAVLVGRMQRFRERVGDEWGARSPASVAFVLDLVDVRRGDIIWTARFDETQKPLSENIFAISQISQRGIRWLSAEQLAQAGVKQAIDQLHQILTRERPS